MAACNPPRSDVCKEAASDSKEVAINSAGTYCFDRSRLLGIAPGADGLGGVADYVRVSAPSIAGETFDDASVIRLIVDVRPDSGASCLTNDGKLTCVASVPGTRLHAIVEFRQPGAGRYEERTGIIAADVAKNVIRSWREQ
jgi:hypothetical protein